MFFKKKIDGSLINSSRVVLVGNAPIEKNIYRKRCLPDFIDDSDVVIRINSANNYSKGTGNKSDILGIVNIGDPAIEYSYRREINKHVKDDISSIWFSRPLNLFSESKVLTKKELSEHILNFQKLNHIPSHAISKELYQSVTKKIAPPGGGNVFDPSSGFCLLHMMLSAEKFANLKKVLVGFTWSGWDGHNWDLEEKICLDFYKKGDIYIL